MLLSLRHLRLQLLHLVLSERTRGPSIGSRILNLSLRRAGDLIQETSACCALLVIYVIELDLWLLRLIEDVDAWDRVCNHFDVSIVVDIVIADIGAALGIWNRVVPRLEGRLFLPLRIQIVLLARLRLRYED